MMHNALCHRSLPVMIVSLAAFEDRLAAVFESAESYPLFRLEDGQIYPVGLLSLPKKDPTERITALAAHGVSLLVCGAICGCHRRRCIDFGIEVVPWVCGSSNSVLAALVENSLNTLRMPGCSESCCFVKRRRG